MKLREAIDALVESAPGEIVYIGSGSGWIYIGEINESLQPFIDKQSEAYRKVISKLNDKASSTMKSHWDRIHEIVEEIRFIEKLMKDTDDADLTLKLDKQIRRLKASQQFLENRILDLTRQIKTRTRDLGRWTDFSDREVKTTYHNGIAEPPGAAIVFEGSEIGPYWTKDEFDRKRKKGE